MLLSDPSQKIAIVNARQVFLAPMSLAPSQCSADSITYRGDGKSDTCSSPARGKGFHLSEDKRGGGYNEFRWAAEFSVRLACLNPSDCSYSCGT